MTSQFEQRGRGYNTYAHESSEIRDELIVRHADGTVRRRDHFQLTCRQIDRDFDVRMDMVHHIRRHTLMETNLYSAVFEEPQVSAGLGGSVNPSQGGSMCM